MSTRKQQLAAALVATSFIAAGAAHAQSTSDTGWMGGKMDMHLYLGGSIGQSRFQDACDGVPGACDNKDTGYRVFAGWQFHPNFAVEGGYLNLGEATANAGGVVASAKMRGWEVLGVAMFPVWQQLSLYGKAGVVRSRVNVNSNIGVSASDNSWDFTFGFGGEWAFSRNVAARLEWQRYDNVGGNNTGRDDIDYFNASLLYRF